MNEERYAIERLEERYEAERRQIQNNMQAIEEQQHYFRKETEMLFDKVQFLAREDAIDLEKLNWQFMEIDDAMHKECRRHCEQLDEEQDDLRRKLKQAVEQIEADAQETCTKQK